MWYSVRDTLNIYIAIAIATKISWGVMSSLYVCIVRWSWILRFLVEM